MELAAGLEVFPSFEGHLATGLPALASSLAEAGQVVPGQSRPFGGVSDVECAAPSTRVAFATGLLSIASSSSEAGRATPGRLGFAVAVVGEDREGVLAVLSGLLDELVGARGSMSETTRTE